MANRNHSGDSNQFADDPQWTSAAGKKRRKHSESESRRRRAVTDVNDEQESGALDRPAGASTHGGTPK